ncbi:hypothetical protein NPIL_339811 [Nephila pilipes]|uniref:Ras family protein n=1 Tax=Nephila pilipes TaxID=299642 RepID=A0A8X6KR49_NEPPI|nr:hypothetical protein NPIL_339811 [Nephila pilipes]
MSGKSTLFNRFNDLGGNDYDDFTVIPRRNLDAFYHYIPIVPPGRRPGVYLICADFEPAPQPEEEFAASFETPIPQMGAICFCMDISDRTQFEVIYIKAFLYAQYFLQNMPSTILIGTKIDERLEYDDCLTPGQGRRLASAIGAIRYIECSAWRKVGVRRVFRQILHMTL